MEKESVNNNYQKLYSIPKLSNNRSSGTPSTFSALPTNCSFATIQSPKTVASHSNNMVPFKGIEKCSEYKFGLNRLICSICNKPHCTIKCRVKSCKKCYHRLCLMDKYRDCTIEQIGIINNSHSSKYYYIYCPDHVHLHKVTYCVFLEIYTIHFYFYFHL